MRSFSCSNHKSREKAGFTLLEMLLVIAIIAILAAIVIVAINPARQLAQARNAQRASDINALYKAVQQYYIDEREWPWQADTYNGGTPNANEASEICGTGAASDDAECIDLDALTPTYISALPQNHGGENYVMALDTDSRISMGAPGSADQELTAVYIGSNSFVIAAANATTTGGGGEEEPDIAALREGLVVYLPLDSDTDDYSDSGDNDAQCNNCPSATTGIVGGAYSFDGSNDYLFIMNSQDFPYNNIDKSVSFWIKTSSDQEEGEASIFNYGSLCNESWGIMQNTNLKYSYCGIVDEVDDTAVNDNGWHHVLMTFDTDTDAMRVYLDGSLEMSFDDSNQYMTPSGEDISLGFSDWSGPPQYWNGILDEVAVWERTLSLTEIADLYNDGDGLSLILN